MVPQNRSDSNRVSGRRIALATFAVLLAGTQAVFAFEPLTYYGFDGSRQSEASREGMEEIFSGALFHQALPTANARMMLRALAASGKSLGYDPASPEGRFHSSGRFASPPDRAQGADQDFGLGESVFDRDGVEMVNINCFSCHSGVVNGQVVAGLGNNHINQSDPKRLRTRGDNFGPYAVWRMGSKLVNPAEQGLVIAKGKTELEKLLDSGELPPVDPMPWWLMKYKTKDYWYADAGPHDASSFSINFTTTHDTMNEHHADHIKSVAKALAFARETNSPPFPETLNADLVARGADIFHGRTRPQMASGFMACKTCHGTYTKKEGHEDLSQPGSWTVDYNNSHILRNVKTDDAYNVTLQRLGPIAEHINQLASYYEAQGTPELTPKASVPSKSGYVAPPLVGVWASAPYFHNGSVPTVEAVLNSKLRPEIWSRDSHDPHAYDLQHVGIKYAVVSQAELDEKAAAAKGKAFLSQPAIEYGAIYDTKGFGHGNMGHTFGDNLTDSERLAVIEFLKSLSGPDM